MALTLSLVKFQKAITSWRSCSAVVAAVLLILVLTGRCALAAQTESPTQAYLFKQTSVIQGTSEVLISPLGVKLTLTDRHVAIFMRPPLWHVQYCDVHSKRYFECDKDQFREPFARTISFVKPSTCTNLVMQSSKPLSYMNLQCKEFTLINPVKSEGKRTRSWEEMQVRSGTCNGYDDGTAKIVGRTLCRIYAMPYLDAVPLLVTVKNYRDEKSNELETTSVKKVTAMAADFIVPPHSVQVAKETEVLVEYHVDSSLTELLK